MSAFASVLNIQGGAVTTGMSADCEVQKLKDLVKKLERQNQHLRYKTGKLSPYTRNESSASADNSNMVPGSSSSGAHRVEHGTSVESFASDAENTDNEDDTMWLYVSPKQEMKEDRSSLETWLRGELDHPSTPQLALAKKSIISSLKNPYDYDSFKKDPHSLELASPYLVNAIKSAYHEGPQPQYSEPSAVTECEHQSITHKLFPSDDEEEELDVQDLPNRLSHENEDTSIGIHQVHHMPLPSHTMTSVHGLVPSNSVPRRRQRSPSPRAHTADERRAGRHKSPLSSRGDSLTRRQTRKPLSERASLTPQTESPKSLQSARSMSDTRRGRSSSPRADAGNLVHAEQIIRQNSGNTRLCTPSSLIRSSSPGYGISSSSDANKPRIRNLRQIKPPSRSARANKGYHSEPNSVSLLVSQPTDSAIQRLTPRRSLPRPSQASQNHFQNQNAKHVDVIRKSTTSFNFIGEQHELGSYSSQCGSDSGGSDVWKDGEFF